jgi:ABC-type multidrug transport system fused ATPase/permease subunit
MITAEVEPLGGFIGEALAVPVFYGGMLIVILTFMLVQDPMLGTAAIVFYPFQAWIIPKLQFHVNELGKRRVREVRRVADLIGESASGVTDIHANDASQHALARFAYRMGRIYDIRYEIYRRKFFIKFLNKFLDKLIPFFFYAIGGYLVIQGNLSFGALVAVLVAYKDLAAPWKELLNHYQRRADARIKYEQVVVRFAPPDMLPAGLQDRSNKTTAPDGALKATNVSFVEEGPVRLVDGVSLSIGPKEHVAIVGPGGAGKDTLGTMLAGLVEPSGGRVSLGGVDLFSLPQSARAQVIGYAGPGAALFNGTLSFNLYMSLRHEPQRDTDYAPAEAEAVRKARTEAGLAGNIEFDPNADWIDLAAVGAADHDALARRAIEVIGIVDMRSKLYRLGLRGIIDIGRHPDMPEKVLVARRAMEARLDEPDLAALVENFDPELFNRNASIAENLLFGAPRGDRFNFEALAENDYVRDVLDEAGLTKEFLAMGKEIASVMVELFSGLEPGHEFFDQYSFVSSDDLVELQLVMERIGKLEPGDYSEDDRRRLLSLPFRVVPSRHRLGVIDEAITERIVRARRIFREKLPARDRAAIAFYDPDAYNEGASLEDNILFGKLAYGHPDGEAKLGQLIESVIEELNLRTEVEEVGLDWSVGVGGGRLASGERQRIAIARAILKRPRIIILNDALNVLDNASQGQLLEAISQEFEGKCMIAVLPRARLARDFERVIVMEAGRVVEDGSYAELDREGSRLQELLKSE